MCKDNEKIKIGSISYFKKPIHNTIPYATVSLFDVYNVVKDTYFKRATDDLRKIADKKTASLFKSRSFDYVCFSGIFSSRACSKQLKHSGLMVLDFDDIKDPFKLKEVLLNDPKITTALLFISPSGKGIKWVIPIDIAIATQAQYFEGVKNYLHQTYGYQVDNSGKDVARACFISHDPDVFINPKYLEV